MRKLIFTMILGFALIGANAQTASPELVSSSGDSFKNTSYQLDWSIGECVTATLDTSDYVITQGFHQNTYNITSVVDLCADIEISVYPNPTSDLINLKLIAFKNLTGFQNLSALSYRVTDISGKVLAKDKILSALQTLNFTNYTDGTYLISITENNQLIKSFQIIKN